MYILSPGKKGFTLANGQRVRFLLGYLCDWREQSAQIVDVRCRRILDGVEYGLNAKDGPSQLSLRSYLRQHPTGGYVVVCNHRGHEFPSFSFTPYYNRVDHVTYPSLAALHQPKLLESV